MANEAGVFLLFSLVYFLLFLLVIAVAFGICKLKLHYRFLFKVIFDKLTKVLVNNGLWGSKGQSLIILMKNFRKLIANLF